MYTQVLGTGHALPPRILNNQELEQMVDTTNDWIIERTGVQERRIAGPDIKTSDLCWQASLMALENAGVSPQELDLIVVGTTTPDMLFPSTACIIQERLAAWNAAAFDMEAGCTGFVYALTIAEKFLLSPAYNKILVVGSDLCSRFVDYTDRNTCVLFGDGAGAAVLGKGIQEWGVLQTYMGADGRGGKHLYMPGGGSANPPTLETINNRMHFIKMNGQEIFRFASKIVVEVADRLLCRAGLGYEDIDLFIPHQANLRIIQTAIKRMDIAPEKVIINLDKFGNMSAACIPVALSMACREGRLQNGDLVLMIAFGAGLTYGGVLLRWGRDRNAD